MSTVQPEPSPALPHSSEHSPVPAAPQPDLRARLRAASKAVILLGLTAYFAYTYFSGQIYNYINPQFTWLSLLAAILFIPLSLASLGELLARPASEPSGQNAQHEHDHHHEHHHEPGDQHHEHSALSWPVLAIVAMPLFLGVVIPSRPLGADAVQSNMSGASNFTSEVFLWPTTPEEQWNMVDWRNAFYSNEKPKEWFNDRPAEVIGFVVRPDGIPAGHFVLGRFVMRHCAADAYGVGMLIEMADQERLAEDTWVHLQGKLEAIKVDGGDVLVLHVTSVDAKIGEPRPPYLSPWWNPAPQFPNRLP